MQRRKHAFALGLLLTVATSVPALAQQPSGSSSYPECKKQPGPNESESAHQRYIAGKIDYDEANYDSAIRRFKSAYEIDCTKHDLLIIISAAYERQGNKKEAITALETYIARVPGAPDAQTYQNKIENLKKQLAATPPPTATTTAPSNPTPPADSNGHSPWPWVVVGVGGAAVVVGIVVFATAPPLPPGCGDGECKPQPGETQTSKIFVDRRGEAGQIRGQEYAGITVTAIGGVLVVGGLLWHFLEPTGPSSTPASATRTRKRLTPALAPGYAGLSFGGAF